VHGTIYEFEGSLPLTVPVAQARVRSRGVSAGTRAPLIGIIRNPRSHRNKGHSPEFADRPNVLTRTPRTRAALRAELADFAARGIEYLAVDGGDGTVRDVLTCGEDIFAGAWPQLIVLPKGKTNALAVALGLPNHWSLAEALDAVAQGRTIERRPLVVELPAQAREGDGGPDAPPLRVQGFILGAGIFTQCTEAAQRAHKLGAFNSFAVLLTIVWGMLKSFFGAPSGTEMRLAAGPDRIPLPDSGRGGPGRRYLLLASTLDRFPLGIKPFGPHRDGLMMTLVDAPLRRILAMIPLLATGVHWSGLTGLGAHRLAFDQEVELELGDRFILDGEYFPAGHYVLRQGAPLRFVVP